MNNHQQNLIQNTQPLLGYVTLIEHQQLQNLYNELLKENTYLKAKFNESCQKNLQYDALVEDNKLKEIRIQFLEAENADLHEQIKLLKAENFDLKAQITKLNQTVLTLNEKITELNIEIVELKEEIVDLKEEIVDLKEEIVDLKESFQFEKYKNKLIIAIQDVNELETLEKQFRKQKKDPSFLVELRTGRNGFSHYIKKKRDTPDMIKYKFNLIAEQMKNAPDDIRDFFINEFDYDVLGEILPYIPITKTLFLTEEEKRKCNAWWK